MVRFSARLAACVLLGSATILPAQTPPPGELADTARPLAYRIDLTVDPAKDRFTGLTSIDVEVKTQTDTLFLHGNDLKVAQVEARSSGGAANPASYAQVLPTGVAQLKFARPLAPGRHTLVFSYDAPFRTGSEGLYHAKAGDTWYAWTQMEPISARRMFPSFDEPRHKVPFTVTVTAPPGQKAFANAPLTRSTQAAEGMVRHEFAPTKPLPTYLVAIAVGPFDVAQATVPANDVRKTPLVLRHIATGGQAARLTYGLQETPKILAMLESYFGIPYPYEKLDQIASPAMGGAMENAGLITYADTLLLLDAAAPLSQQRDFGTVVAHEIAHQWVGNLVTPRWWDDIWLNESFAEWMGNKIAVQWRPEIGAGPVQLAGALDAMRGDSRVVGRPIRQPITRNEDIGSAFDSITYEKGGQVLEMVEAYLGEQKFRQGVQAHLRRYPYGTATAEDFFQSIGSAVGDPRVVRAFQSFVTQQGVPLVQVRRGTNGEYLLTQQRYRPIGVAAGADQLWIVPFCARSGTQRQCTLIEGKEGRLTLSGDRWILPNAAATGYYRFDLDAEDWRQLIDAAPALSGEEAMVVADSAWASFEAGRAPLSTALAAMTAFAGNTDRLAATFIPGNLQAISETLMTSADREGYRRLMARLFVPRLRTLGLDLSRGANASEDADRRQLRQTLTSYVASEARDKAVRQQLVTAAEASLGGNDSALDPAYRVRAFSTAVQDRGVPFIDRLVEAMVVSKDPLFRRQASTALGAADTPELATRIFTLSMDKRLSDYERIFPLFGLLQHDATRDLAFRYMIDNFDTIRPLFGSYGSAMLGMGNGYCSEDKARMVDAALRPKLAVLDAGALDLDRSLAGIRQCAALKQAKGSDIAAALAAAQ